MTQVINKITKEMVQQITEQELRDNLYYLDDDTIITHFKLTDEMRYALNPDEKFWEDEDENGSKTICDRVTCEYQFDTYAFHYYLNFEHDSIIVTDAISCEELDEKVFQAHDC